MLPGGDYGFPNNPIGANARDLGLFVRLFGYSPLEALRAATYYGGLVLDMPVGLLTPGYLADILVVSGSPATDVTVLEDPDEPAGDHAGRPVPQAGRAAGIRASLRRTH